MKKLRVINIILLMMIMFLSGCETHETKHYDTIAELMRAKQKGYVDFEKFKEDRPCGEVTFMCLPESQDKSWQSLATKDKIEDLELTAEVEIRFDKIVKQWHKDYDAYHSKPHRKGEKEPMLISSIDKDFFDKVEERRFLEEMEESLEKEFPGFWRDVPKKVRYRWIRRAQHKAKKYGYKGQRDAFQWAELCARIGLDFDLNPKWKAITEFVSLPNGPLLAAPGMACDYIDFTVFKKDYSPDGDKYTDWYLKEALSYLPKPKRPVPKLND